jgi:hypothetical protein
MTTQDQLKAPSDLNGRHQHTWDAIFRHPSAHNLEWHDVRSLLAALGDVADGQNGALQVTRNGHVMNLHAPKQKDICADDLPEIRRFLDHSSETAISQPVARATHLLVVINHHEAKVYRTVFQGTLPESLVPYDPHGHGQHLHSRNEETDGKRQPEKKTYYEALAATLRGAQQILIFGNGTGDSSAMEQLLAHLKQNHHDVVEHVVGCVVIDAHHLTEGQLLAKARDFFAAKDA